MIETHEDNVKNKRIVFELLLVLSVITGVVIFFSLSNSSSKDAIDSEQESSRTLPDRRKENQVARDSKRRQKAKASALLHNMSKNNGAPSFEFEEEIDDISSITADGLILARRSAQVAREIRSYGKTVYADNAPDVLDGIIENQPEDFSWTRATKSAVSFRMEELQIEGVQLSSVRCGETLCSVALSFDDDDTAGTFDGKLFFEHSQFTTSQYGTMKARGVGTHELKFYYSSREAQGDPFAEVGEIILEKLRTGEIVAQHTES